MGVLQNLREEFVGVLALLVLGAGFLALFVPGLSPVPFWVVWVIGFAVVVPLVAIALGRDEAAAADYLDRERTRERERVEK